MSHWLSRKRNTVVILFSTVLFILVAALPADTQNNQNPLTNADIIRLSKEGVGENIIIRMIETSPNKFDVSVNAVIQLTKEKVSQRVIEAMQIAQDVGSGPTRKSSTTKTNGPKPTPSPTPSPTPVPSQTEGLFTFELEQCAVTGRVVSCDFTIANNGRDRQILLRLYETTLVDNLNSPQLKAVSASFREAENKNPSEPNIEILSISSVRAVVKFQGISPEAQKIGRLNISFTEHTGNTFFGQTHMISFRNVPLKRSTNSSSGASKN